MKEAEVNYCEVNYEGGRTKFKQLLNMQFSACADEQICYTPSVNYLLWNKIGKIFAHLDAT